MQDLEHTLTSPLFATAGHATRMLAATVLWHPDPALIGAQCLGPAGPGTLELGRYAPLFNRADGGAAPLADLRIARAPVRIDRHADDGGTVTAPPSRMTLSLDGMPVGSQAALTAQALERGAVLELGASVIVCLHWMRGLPQVQPGTPILGVSDAAVALRELVRQAAATELHVLLLGETGTGKEVAARAIHQASARRHARLVSVNMAALNESLAASDLFGAERGAYTGAVAAREGLFAEAQGGTLFLDEIGDTPATIQPMLLRVLESGEYRPLGARENRVSTARLIAATDQALGAGDFNQPLLRRLEAFVIRVPALRERRADIGLLMAEALRRMDAAPELPFDLVSAICRHDWPGNVRQLMNVVRRAALSLRALAPLSFDELAGAPLPRPAHGIAAVAEETARPAARRRLSEVSDNEVLHAMQASGWQVSAAAALLGLSRPSLYKLLAAHRTIRQPRDIDNAEIGRVLREHGGDIEECAASLCTPAEALRRHVRTLGW